MRHKIVRLLGLMVILTQSAVSLTPTRAQQTGFAETFDDPALPGWEVKKASVANGVLHVEPAGFAFHPGKWSDFALAIRSRYDGDGIAGIGYSSTDAGEYLLQLGTNNLSLARAGMEIGRFAHDLPSGEWAQIEIAVQGGAHTITVNQHLAITAIDSNPLTAGGIVLRSAGGTASQFDDLALTESISPQPVVSGPTPPAASTSLPAYQAGPWVRTGGPLGGLGYDVRYNFDDLNIWYVTDAWSGFHISTDRGLTWTPSNQGIVSSKPPDAIAVFSATVDPHESNIIWIGTELAGDVYKSSDGGHTWKLMYNGEASTSVRGITVDPRTSDIVYAMAEVGSPAWTPDGSVRKGLEMDMTKGMVIRSSDGGQTWSEIWRGDNLARYLWIDPRNPEILYVSTGIFDREAANTDVAAGVAGGVGVLKSTDGGKTWRVQNEANGLLDLYVGSLYMKPDDPDVLLAAASQNNWSFHAGRDTAGIFLTENGGETWTRVVRGELFSVVEYCTSNPQTAYAAGAHAAYRSDDGGHTWQKYNRPDNTWGPEGIIAGFPIDMQCDPENPMRVIANNYLGGNFLSEDGGQTWVNASRGYTGEIVRRVVLAPGQTEVVYTASRSGVFRTENGGDDWAGLAYIPEGVTAKFNEIQAIAVDPSDSDHILAYISDLGSIVYSTDGGQSWKIGQQIGEPADLSFAPSNPNLVYAAVTTKGCIEAIPSGSVLNRPGCQDLRFGVYVSDDGGVTFSPVAGSQTKGAVIAALAVHPTDADTIYVSAVGLGVLRSTDGGQTWTVYGGELPLPPITLAIDPSNPEIIFAGVASSEIAPGGGIYRSTDSGQTWKAFNAGLPPEPLILTIVVDPTNSQIIYAGDQYSGVYVSTDGGQTWQAANEGLTHRSVVSLGISFDGTILYAGIYGDGVYRLGTPAGKPPVQREPTPAPTIVPPSGPTSPTPESAAKTGICGSAAMMPLALVGLSWLSRRK